MKKLDELTLTYSPHEDEYEEAYHERLKKAYEQEKYFKLRENGLKIKLDESFDFQLLWRSVQKMSGFSANEFGPDEETCKDLFK